MVAADAGERLGWATVSHTFCDYLQSEALTHAHDRTNDRCGIGAFRQILHKGAVNLQMIQREALEVSQIRVASPEIVQRQTDAQRLQSVQALHHGLRLAHHHRFGELEVQVGRFQARFFKNARDEIDQTRLAELERRKIDRNREWREPDVATATTSGYRGKVR